jgi:hypothetical protein
MKYKGSEELQKEILKCLVKGPINGTALQMGASCFNDDIFREELGRLVDEGIIDWTPLKGNVPKDELIPYDSFKRIYHITRPDFSIDFKKIKKKIYSVFRFH